MATLLPPNRSPRPVLCSAYLSSCPTRSLISDSATGGFLRPPVASPGATLEASMECSVCSRTAWESGVDGRVRGGPGGRGRFRAGG